MGEKIKKECLSEPITRVFVSYDGKILRTASHEFWRKYHDSSWVVALPDAIALNYLKTGQTLRITNWHGGMPVKIEVREEGRWRLIFERNELPEGLKCLAEHKLNQRSEAKR